MAKPERTPIFERLQPFAPWDQRSAPNLLDGAEERQRARELAEGALGFGAAADRVADRGEADGSAATLRHLAAVSRWHAEIWQEHFGASPAPSPGTDRSELAADREDLVESLAVLAREAVPYMVGRAILFQADLGNGVDVDRARWLSIIIEDLETARSELELLLQSQLRPGDGERLAKACAEVAKAV